jgi:C4-dicarboxylate-specific signal transduction histidine kinase
MLSKFRDNRNRLAILCCFVALYIIIILVLSIFFSERVNEEKQKLSLWQQKELTINSEQDIVIADVENRLKQLSKDTHSLNQKEYREGELAPYISDLHEVLDLSYQLNQKNRIELVEVLDRNKNDIKKTISFYETQHTVLFVFFTCLFSSLYYIYFIISYKNYQIEKWKDRLDNVSRTLRYKVSIEADKNLKKDKQILKQSRQAQMGEMISMIAHQWRQPLAAISTACISLQIKAQMDIVDKDLILNNTERISGYAKHLSDTIEDFRNFFKIDKNKQPTSYDEVFKAVLSIIEGSLNNKNILLTQDMQCDENIQSYPSELKQVILNLIKNAEDALIDKKIKNPMISIKTYNKDFQAICEISDNAGGIPADILPKIFDPYFSTKIEKNGMGLGLYMSKTIIEDHCGGELIVRNDSDGATFVIRLKRG